MKNSEKLAIQGYINVQSSQGNMYLIGGIIILLIAMILQSTLFFISSFIAIIVGLFCIGMGIRFCIHMRKRTKQLEKLEKEIEYEKAIEELDLLPEKNGFLPWT